MQHIIKKIIQENTGKLVEFKKGLKEEKTIEEILSKWFYTDKIPVSSKHRQWKNVRELKNYLLKRYDLESAKRLEKKLNHIETVKNAPQLESIVVTVDWKKNYEGNQAKAEIKVVYTDNTCEYFNSSRTGGGGYCKESTAVANALNQSNALLKLLYTEKNRPSRINTPNRDLFGYGSGYGFLPSFEGGVGVSCYPQILGTVKMNVEHIANGKAFDVYKYSRV